MSKEFNQPDNHRDIKTFKCHSKLFWRIHFILRPIEIQIQIRARYSFHMIDLLHMSVQKHNFRKAKPYLIESPNQHPKIFIRKTICECLLHSSRRWLPLHISWVVGRRSLERPALFGWLGEFEAVGVFYLTGRFMLLAHIQQFDGGNPTKTAWMLMCRDRGAGGLEKTG